VFALAGMQLPAMLGKKAEDATSDTVEDNTPSAE